MASAIMLSNGFKNMAISFSLIKLTKDMFNKSLWE